MIIKQKSRIMAMLLAFLLVILAGCQSVGGLDLNDVMTKSSAIQSAESRQTITLDLITDSSSLTADEQRVSAALGQVKLSIIESKMQDRQHAYVKGTLDVAKGSIPFELSLDGLTYTLQVDGAKKPVVFNAMASSFSDSNIAPEVREKLVAQINQLTQKYADAAPKLGLFFIRNFNSPDTLNVSQVTESVYGENLQLQKIHAEINGTELVSLVKGFLTNVLADEQGLKDFLGIIYDLYAPIITQVLKGDQTAEAGNPMAEQVVPFLENKTLAVEFAFTFLKTNLKKFLDDYDTTVQNYLASDAGAHVKELTGDNTYLKLDTYVDSDKMTRKSALELQLPFPAAAGSGIKGIKITSSSETWNINKSVTAKTIDASNGVYELSGANGKPSTSRFLAALEPTSVLYKLLKDDLHATHKEVKLSVLDPKYTMAGMAYNDHGTVMAPVRFVSEQLDADVAWNGAVREVTITDPLNGTNVVLTIGSTQAKVNGESVTLEKPAALVNGSTFVPVRFVSEALGSHVQWNGAEQQVIITRD